MDMIGHELMQISSKRVLVHIRSTCAAIGKDVLGFDPYEVRTHSIRASFAMFLFLVWAREQLIKILGRW